MCHSISLFTDVSRKLTSGIYQPSEVTFKSVRSNVRLLKEHVYRTGSLFMWPITWPCNGQHVRHMQMCICRCADVQIVCPLSDTTRVNSDILKACYRRLWRRLQRNPIESTAYNSYITVKWRSTTRPNYSHNYSLTNFSWLFFLGKYLDVGFLTWAVFVIVRSLTPATGASTHMTTARSTVHLWSPKEVAERTPLLRFLW